MNEPLVSFRIPNPPVDEQGQLTINPATIGATLVRGRCSGCCVCHQSCWTWWSPCPPSQYVPLHEGCVERLVERWSLLIEQGDAAPREATPVAAPRVARTGAYARLVSTVGATPRSGTLAAVSLSGQRAAVLPDDFTPGPFWLPGDTKDSPWTVVAETAIGCLIYPRTTRDRAQATAERLEKLRETSDRIPVVAATVVSPDGHRNAAWGVEIDPARPSRWQPITRLAFWTQCWGCDALRWPGTWIWLENLTCLACLAEKELDDPRPALIEPSYPGDRYVPKMFATAPKPLALPKGYRRRRR